MEDKFLVGLDEYKILDEENPIGYVRDIKTCMAILIHKEKNTALLHVESYDNTIFIDNFMELLRAEKGNKIKSVDIFMGDETSIGNLSIIKFILHKLKIDYHVYQVFKDLSNSTSIGYNYLTNDYYMAEMDKGNPKFIKKLLQ